MQHVANNGLVFESELLESHIAEMGGTKPIAHINSLPGLDRLIGGITPGLVTALAAQPSCGKTTLLKQVADDLAEQGHPIIFYSAELPAYRITQKGITRLGGGAFTLSDTNGATPDNSGAFNLACRLYAEKVAPRSCIIDAEVTTTELCRCVGDCVATSEKTPILMVDYLQLVATLTTDVPMDERTAIIGCVRALGGIAKSYDVPVFVLSSMQRGKYDDPNVGLDVFGGSQSIDYGIDNGLYLYVEGKDKRERQLNMEAKIRPVAVRALKARYGTLGTAKLAFDAAHATFHDRA